MRGNFEKRIGHRKEFLNLDYLISLKSSIGYTVKVSAWGEELTKEKLCNCADIEFSIADCHKYISLDFNIDDDENMVNSLHKLDVIINTCKEMRKDLKTARLEIIKGIKRQEELTKIEEEKEN